MGVLAELRNGFASHTGVRKEPVVSDATKESQSSVQMQELCQGLSWCIHGLVAEKVQAPDEFPEFENEQVGVAYKTENGLHITLETSIYPRLGKLVPQVSVWITNEKILAAFRINYNGEKYTIDNSIFGGKKVNNPDSGLIALVKKGIEDVRDGTEPIVWTKPHYPLYANNWQHLRNIRQRGF